MRARGLTQGEGEPTQGEGGAGTGDGVGMYRACRFQRAQQKAPGVGGVVRWGQKRGCMELYGDQSLGIEGNLGAQRSYQLE